MKLIYTIDTEAYRATIDLEPKCKSGYVNVPLAQAILTNSDRTHVWSNGNGSKQCTLEWDSARNKPIARVLNVTPSDPELVKKLEATRSEAQAHLSGEISELIRLRKNLELLEAAKLLRLIPN